jgi:hypothetical protein
LGEYFERKSQIKHGNGESRATADDRILAKKIVFHSSSSAIISAENVAMKWNVVNNNDQKKRSIDAERINCLFVLRAIWVSLKVSDFKDSSRVFLIPTRMSSLNSSLLLNLICSAALFAFWSQPRRILSGCAQEKDCWLIADNKVIAHNAREVIAFWYPINPIMMNAHR